MDFVFKFIFVFLLGTKFAPALGGITKNDDGSVEFSAGSSYMKIGPNNALIIRDEQSVLEVDSSGSVTMTDGKSLFTMKDSGASLEIKDGNTLIKKCSSGFLKLADGSTFLEVDTKKQTVEMGDGKSSLKKDSQSSKLVDGNSSITKRADKSLEIIDGSSQLKIDSNGAINMVDKNTMLSIKDSGATVTMVDGASSIQKANGRVELKDGNTLFVKDNTGFMEMKDKTCSVTKTKEGMLTLTNGKAKLIKDPVKESIKQQDGKTLLVKDKNGVRVVLRLSQDEMEDLIAKIENQSLIVDGVEEVKEGKGWRQFTITAPVHQNLKEEHVMVCYSTKNGVAFVVPKSGQTVKCPKGTIKSETLKQFKETHPSNA